MKRGSPPITIPDKKKKSFINVSTSPLPSPQPRSRSPPSSLLSSPSPGTEVYAVWSEDDGLVYKVC